MTSIFMCLPAGGGGLFWQAPVALLLVLAFVFFKFGIGKAAAQFNRVTAPFEVSPRIFEEIIPDLDYLEKSLHLSEKMMSDLTSGIQSVERKSLAVITGAAALAVFLTAKDWCPEPSNTIRVFGIVSCIAAIFIAGLVISATDIGMSGAPPSMPVNFWKKLEQELPADMRRDNVRNNYMYTAILIRYQQAVESSYKVAYVKISRFAVAAYCLFAGFCAAVSWVAIKLLPVLTG